MKMSTRKFIISLSESDFESEKNFWTSLSQIKNITWWHWLPTTWLVIDTTGKIDIKYLTDLVGLHFPKSNFLISEVEVKTWIGKGQTINEKSMFDWLKKFWTKRPIGNIVN